MTLERDHLKRIIEATLFAAGQPMSVDKLGELFYEEERPSNEIFRELLAEIETDYRERGVQLKEVASGFRFQARHEVGEWVSRLWEEKPQRYSRALLETLALIAYRQPITRGEVEDIRGVSVSSHIIKTLQEREWVRVLGYRDVPGRPAMYGTTKAFLDYFSLKSLEDLPTLAEVRDLDKISAELDERLQQAQPQATLPLESVTVTDAPREASSPPSGALLCLNETSLSLNEVAPHQIEECSPQREEPLEATSGSIHEEVDTAAIVFDAHTLHTPSDELSVATSPASTAQGASQTTFATLRARFSSIFDAPVEAVDAPDAASSADRANAASPPSTTADDGTIVSDHEIPPSPVEPRDSRLE